MTTPTKGPPMFEKIALIGIGLIGGSIALAARRGGFARKIVAATRRPETAETANRLKLVDHCGTDLAAACEDADLVIVCTPVGACGEATRIIASKLKPGCIVSDVGSVKQAVVDAMQPHIPAGHIDYAQRSIHDWGREKRAPEVVALPESVDELLACGYLGTAIEVIERKVKE